MRENLRRLRAMQRDTRERELQESKQPVKALWKSSKYENVESKVKEELEKELNAPRPHSASYLRAHSRTGLNLCGTQSARPSSTEPPGVRDDLATNVPSKASTARDIGLIRREIDFIHVNGMLAKKYGNMMRSPSLSSLDDTSTGAGSRRYVDKEDLRQVRHKAGEVPKYLLERKMQWLTEERERRANLTDPDMPPGHRLMPDAERKDTLEKIQQKHRELEQELMTMPISNDSMRVRKRREELLEKLSKVEEAIKIFSRQKVFVKLDS